MPRKLPREAPAGAITSSFSYTVPFFDTDAMGIVHHANYVRYLELGRVQFLKDHDRPYTRYLDAGLHVAVIGVQTAYHRPCRFADTLEIVCWLSWIRAASLGFGYLIRNGDELALTGRTDHAVITDEGRPIRFPQDVRDTLGALCGHQGPARK